MKWWMFFLLITVIAVGVRVYMEYNPDVFTGRIRSMGSVVNVGRECEIETGECFLTVKDDRQRVFKIVYGGRFCHAVQPLVVESGDEVEFYGLILEETVYQKTLEVCSDEVFYVNRL